MLRRPVVEKGRLMKDRGPWSVAESEDRINSDDFTHDASLILYGDFAEEHKKPYLQFIADQLNSCALLRAKAERLEKAVEWALHPDNDIRWDHKYHEMLAELRRRCEEG